MKTNKHLSQWLLLSAMLIALVACQKSISEQQAEASGTKSTPQSLRPTDTTAPPPAPYPQSPVTGCAYDPNYGDSIIYPQPTTGGHDYIVLPVNNPGPGKYLSWPMGLVLDSVTGAIDVTKSETGERFAIGFVKSGTKDTCLTNLIIGGGAYMDSVYVIADNQKTAYPYFDANPAMGTICGSAGACKFDITGSAAKSHVYVNPSTGTIDLAKTLNGTGLLSPGVFGLLPLDGETATTTIYYQLNDASNMAVQHIQVEFMFYNSKSSINSSLLGGLVTKLDNVLSGNIIDRAANPRPPLIIITRRN